MVAKHMPGDYDIEYASAWAGANYWPYVQNFLLGFLCISSLFCRFHNAYVVEYSNPLLKRWEAGVEAGPI